MLRRYISLFIIVAITSFNSYAFETKAQYAVLMDYETGKVLFEKDANEEMKPSSMTKLMTVYLLFERLKNDILKLDDKFTVSVKAWKTGGSKMFLRHTERVTIEDLIKGIVVQSGNDACVTVAEGISSSEESFAELMNKKAKELGLANSHFVNSTGLPHENHYMSALDIAKLSHHIIRDFPDYYHYFSIPKFTHAGITQQNRNLLLAREIAVDGLKTGHTEDAGYGMAVSGTQEGRRLIAVVNGLNSEMARTDEAEKLLNYGFRYFENRTLYKKGDIIEKAEVWSGTQDKVSLVTTQDITLMIPKLKSNDIKITLEYDSPIAAPINKGDQLATLNINIPDSESKSFTLVAGADVDRANWLIRAIDSAKSYFIGSLE